MLTTWPALMTDRELDLFLARIDRIFSRGRPWVHIVDARDATRSAATPRMRAAAVAFMERLPAERVGLLLGEGFVISSAPVRGALTALTWMFQPAWPRVMLGTMPEAERWARERLRASTPVAQPSAM